MLGTEPRAHLASNMGLEHYCSIFIMLEGHGFRLRERDNYNLNPIIERKSY